MSRSSATEPETIQRDVKAVPDGTALTTAGKTKVERAHSYLTVAYTGMCVAGAIGAAFVWVATTFFLGDVQIRPTQAVDGITIKVIDKRGQAATYFGKDVQLMPGKYHLEIGLNDRPGVQHSDVNVQLWKITSVPFTVPSAAAQGTIVGQDGTAAAANVAAKTGSVPTPDTANGRRGSLKHWWQVWKKLP